MYQTQVDLKHLLINLVLVKFNRFLPACSCSNHTNTLLVEWCKSQRFVTIFFCSSYQGVRPNFTDCQTLKNKCLHLSFLHTYRRSKYTTFEISKIPFNFHYFNMCCSKLLSYLSMKSHISIYTIFIAPYRYTTSLKLHSHSKSIKKTMKKQQQKIEIYIQMSI